MNQEATTKTTPPAMMAIIQATRISGDRSLERAARAVMKEQFGITLTFSQNSPRQQRPAR
jgi:hypothetical protein